MSDDHLKQEKALMTIASISLNCDLPLEKFYNVASFFIRNLINQAYLIERIEFAQGIIKLGYLNCINELIQKCMRLLEHDTKLPANQQNPISIELYQTVIEQCFVNLSELFHFIEHGDLLKQLTQSEHTQQYFQLLLNCQTYPYMTVKIFRQISVFFKEMSSDNTYAKIFYSQPFCEFIKTFAANLNEDNCEFVSNLIVFFYNVLFNQGGFQLVHQNMEVINAVIAKIFSYHTPQQVFMKEFSSKYKPADKPVDENGKQKQKDADENEDENEDMLDEVEEEDDNEAELKEVKEDNVVKSVEYRLWKSLARSNQSVLDLLCEIIALSSSDQDDDEFEEIDDDEPAKDSNNEIVIDTDVIKKYCADLILSGDYYSKILQRAEAVPQYLGLPQEIETLMNEVQESSFGLLLNVIQNLGSLINQDMIYPLIASVKGTIDLNLYKCEETLFESLMQITLFVLNNDQSGLMKPYLFEQLLDPLIRLGNYVQLPEIKQLCVMALTLLLSTESSHSKSILTTPENIHVVSEILISSCKSGNLLLIAHAINGFFDIFSEANYNQSLVEKQVLEMMRAGLSALEQLYVQQSKAKIYSKNELKFAKESIENLPSFIDYKVKEMGLQ
ncbi:UNKNOWN [Stylonychia lemnae]|uniref:SYO1-like TPR repeats domain-containing protein n=1 Tax=Stylonychia lemnae TaxID=5949 RepID=A0A077ZZQ2_STYLE|nr:UNKNOWN [Stylonychia lemnae]|eukprot:CDW75365.1 UNKNOWN [Stylonychia lemnae]